MKIAISAAETSGDLIGAALVKSLFENECFLDEESD